VAVGRTVRDKTEVLRQSVAAGRTVRDKTEVLRQCGRRTDGA
jgi:hypothetical protein